MSLLPGLDREGAPPPSTGSLASSALRSAALLMPAAASLSTGHIAIFKHRHLMLQPFESLQGQHSFLHSEHLDLENLTSDF